MIISATCWKEDLDKDDFLADKRTQQAVILNIVVIKDHPEFIGRHPDVPWRNMKGMRNRIAHGYFDINLDIVWETVRTALPPLVERLAAIRDELANGSD